MWMDKRIKLYCLGFHNKFIFVWYKSVKLHRNINWEIFKKISAGVTAVLKNTKLFNFSTHLQRELEECAKLPLYMYIYIYIMKKVKRVWSFISADIQLTNELQCSIQPEQNFVPSSHVTLNDLFPEEATNDSAMCLRPSLLRAYLIIQASLSISTYTWFPSKFQILSLYFPVLPSPKNFLLLPMLFLLFWFSTIIYFQRSTFLFRFHSG